MHYTETYRAITRCKRLVHQNHHARRIAVASSCQITIRPLRVTHTRITWRHIVNADECFHCNSVCVSHTYPTPRDTLVWYVVLRHVDQWFSTVLGALFETPVTHTDVTHLNYRCDAHHKSIPTKIKIRISKCAFCKYLTWVRWITQLKILCFQQSSTGYWTTQVPHSVVTWVHLLCIWVCKIVPCNIPPHPGWHITISMTSALQNSLEQPRPVDGATIRGIEHCVAVVDVHAGEIHGNKTAATQWHHDIVYKIKQLHHEFYGASCDIVHTECVAGRVVEHKTLFTWDTDIPSPKVLFSALF